MGSHARWSTTRSHRCGQPANALAGSMHGRGRVAGSRAGSRAGAPPHHRQRLHQMIVDGRVADGACHVTLHRDDDLVISATGVGPIAAVACGPACAQRAGRTRSQAGKLDALTLPVCHRRGSPGQACQPQKRAAHARARNHPKSRRRASPPAATHSSTTRNRQGCCRGWEGGWGRCGRLSASRWSLLVGRRAWEGGGGGAREQTRNPRQGSGRGARTKPALAWGVWESEVVYQQSPHGTRINRRPWQLSAATPASPRHVRVSEPGSSSTRVWVDAM